MTDIILRFMSSRREASSHLKMKPENSVDHQLNGISF